jgi:hypothetical protein
LKFILYKTTTTKITRKELATRSFEKTKERMQKHEEMDKRARERGGDFQALQACNGIK